MNIHTASFINTITNIQYNLEHKLAFEDFSQGSAEYTLLEQVNKALELAVTEWNEKETTV